VHPPEIAPPTPAQASSPAEDFPVLGHPFNSLQEWDPAHETSLELEHLWQIPPGDVCNRLALSPGDVCNRFAVSSCHAWSSYSFCCGMHTVT